MDYIVTPLVGKPPKKIWVTVPGSKSITARAFLLAALAKGESTLNGASLCDDCLTFLECLKALGISVCTNGTTVKIWGCGGVLPVSNATINVGSAGTAARFLTAMLAFQRGSFTMNCSEQMKHRPIKPLIDTLKQLGATFEFLEEENSFPFVLHGTNQPSKKISVEIAASSQFLSGLLMAAVCARYPVQIVAQGAHGMDYVNMTLDMMWSFGVTVQEEEASFTVSGQYLAKTYDIEPDVSAACYFYAINKIAGTELAVKGILPHTMQGDYQFIKLMKDFEGGTVDMAHFSDQALTLAAIAPYLKKPTHICNIAHVRGQECDRISAMCANLQAMGVKVEEHADGVTIYPATPHGATLPTFGDHRVAMAFAVCGTVTQGIAIQNAEVCAKTFPTFFEVLTEITNQLTNQPNS
jgi:3-phosphoshikimate 1-carboxyvinyltransferase